MRTDGWHRDTRSSAYLGEPLGQTEKLVSDNSEEVSLDIGLALAAAS